MDLVTINKELYSLSDKLSELDKSYKSEKQKLNEEKAELLRKKDLFMIDADMDKVAVAESLLVFSQGFKRYNAGVLEKAYKDLVNGGSFLKHSYFGVKDYAHFTNQHVECSYGMGPRHGYVVFSIGLRRSEKELTPEQINACLYYLEKLKDANFRNVAGQKH